ncbi:hypothetical protein [Alkalimarinus sediminis]|uniref:DUF1449 domain-containing protein n=1 Tax=Alkalimarinus sediminis TaxID=1632866 RepID=A0A9E8HHW7_9ALTE|nr:hypothetical protein [Alkalimarinus sediminis]UZW74970.1 hypothetical protein NNL22_18415 [Alkalimarinus sediminis]
MFAILLSDKMDPFYQNIASFPTAIFTFFLVICLLYWLVAVLGFIDLDVLDFDIPDPDGRLGVNQTDLSTPDVLAGLMLKLGLYGVPVTIIVSFIALFGWFTCYFIVHFFFGLVPDGLLRYLAGLPVLLGTLYVAVMLTAIVIKPIRPFFKKASQNTVKEVLGQTAIVRSSKVNSSFGEVFLADGGAGLIFKARSTGDEVFNKGDRVVLLEYKEVENVYRVISEKEFLN